MTTEEMTRSLRRAENALAYLGNWANLDQPERIELSAARQAVFDVKLALEAQVPETDEAE